uniref:Uncharacterized protein n=1 Tax=Rhizophora mucronata TaxID=61149 RepID=A0A2P2QR66_RHIMU
MSSLHADFCMRCFGGVMILKHEISLFIRKI